MRKDVVKVTISGPAGAGKTQVAEALAWMLFAAGVNVELFDSEGRTVRANHGTDVKNIPKTTYVQVHEGAYE